ncbi:MAG: formyl-CoA transferase [Ilumatobacteraceae bacterium]|nr:formyl-CoA transferase [Ilumatobacteraceae bacterium]
MSDLPLARFKVLDLTRVRSGPTAARQFADWGADVIMIEAIGGTADISGPRRGSDFQNLNRNKRSIRLDLKSTEGREVFYRLAGDADVVLENFRPDVKERLGVDFHTLHRLNPRLVYGSISGFGEDGPYRYRPGLDQIVQGMGGLMSVTGLPGQGPVRAGIAVADSASGLYCALGVLTALLEREVTGEGRWVTTSLLQAQIAMLDFQAARWLAEGDLAGQEGNNHPTAVPMGLFAAADGHVNIAAAGDRMFTAFCRAADAEHLLVDERFAEGRARITNRAALNDAIAPVIARRTVAEWIESLNAAGVPCGPVNSIDAVFADPQVQHLRMARTIHDEGQGDTTVVGQGFDLSDVEARFDQRAPAGGEHTTEVLAAAGYSADEVADLLARGVVGATGNQAAGGAR